MFRTTATLEYGIFTWYICFNVYEFPKWIHNGQNEQQAGRLSWFNSSHGRLDFVFVVFERIGYVSNRIFFDGSSSPFVLLGCVTIVASNVEEKRKGFFIAIVMAVMTPVPSCGKYTFGLMPA